MEPLSRRGALGLFAGVGVMPLLSSEAIGQEGKSSYAQGTNPFLGTWTYRSFRSVPAIETPFNDLEFARGILTVEASPFGTFRGRLDFGPDAQVALVGAASYGNPFTVRFQGKGDKPASKEWVYDYLGYLVPGWPNGVDQRPAIVGTIVRTEPHPSGSGGTAPTGVVAQWIALKHDPSR
jgi:hypothetical protein